MPNRGASFAMVAADYFALNQGAWRSPIHRQQWESSIRSFAVPALGTMPVGEIGADAVQAVLAPLWTSKPVAGQRLRGRLEKILDYASALGLRPASVANPAAMKCMQHLLPKTRREERHHAAVDVDDAPLLMATLAEIEGIAARALEFTILTCVRSAETLGALWSEFDLAARVWLILPERTKSGRPFRVPLSAPALQLITDLPRAGPSGGWRCCASCGACAPARRRTGSDRASRIGQRKTHLPATKRARARCATASGAIRKELIEGVT